MSTVQSDAVLALKTPEPVQELPPNKVRVDGTLLDIYTKMGRLNSRQKILFYMALYQDAILKELAVSEQAFTFEVAEKFFAQLDWRQVGIGGKKFGIDLSFVYTTNAYNKLNGHLSFEKTFQRFVDTIENENQGQYEKKQRAELQNQDTLFQMPAFLYWLQENHCNKGYCNTYKIPGKDQVMMVVTPVRAHEIAFKLHGQFRKLLSDANGVNADGKYNYVVDTRFSDVLSELNKENPDFVASVTRAWGEHEKDWCAVIIDYQPLCHLLASLYPSFVNIQQGARRNVGEFVAIPLIIEATQSHDLTIDVHVQKSASYSTSFSVSLEPLTAFDSNMRMVLIPQEACVGIENLVMSLNFTPQSKGISFSFQEKIKISERQWGEEFPLEIYPFDEAYILQVGVAVLRKSGITKEQFLKLPLGKKIAVWVEAKVMLFGAQVNTGQRKFNDNEQCLLDYINGKIVLLIEEKRQEEKEEQEKFDRLPLEEQLTLLITARNLPGDKKNAELTAIIHGDNNLLFKGLDRKIDALSKQWLQIQKGDLKKFSELSTEQKMKVLVSIRVKLLNLKANDELARVPETKDILLESLAQEMILLTKQWIEEQKESYSDSPEVVSQLSVHAELVEKACVLGLVEVVRQLKPDIAALCQRFADEAVCKEKGFTYSCELARKFPDLQLQHFERLLKLFLMPGIEKFKVEIASSQGTPGLNCNLLKDIVDELKLSPIARIAERDLADRTKGLKLSAESQPAAQKTAVPAVGAQTAAPLRFSPAASLVTCKPISVHSRNGMGKKA